MRVVPIAGAAVALLAFGLAGQAAEADYRAVASAQADAYLTKQSARARAVNPLAFKLAEDLGVRDPWLERAQSCTCKSRNVVDCDYGYTQQVSFPRFPVTAPPPTTELREGAREGVPHLQGCRARQAKPDRRVSHCQIRERGLRQEGVGEVHPTTERPASWWASVPAPPPAKPVVGPPPHVADTMATTVRQGDATEPVGGRTRPALMAWLHFTGDLPLGDLLVAVGTLLLAGFTWRLAQQTKADVALTRQSVEAIEWRASPAAPSVSCRPGGTRAQAHRRNARGAHRAGSTGCRTGPRRPLERRDRRAAVHQPAHGRLPPAQGLHQARHLLAQPARRGAAQLTLRACRA